MEFRQIKTEAKEALHGNRLMFLLAMLLISAVVGFTAGLGALIAPVLTAGLFLLGKVLLIEKKFNFEHVFEYFKDLNHALKLIGVGFLYGIIVFAGFLLLIIPGIIFAYQFSQVTYVMAENKEMGVWDAFRQSRELMKGHKFELFIFQLSFIGHVLLGIITFGIYMFYAMPYIQLSMFNFYLHLKRENSIGNVVSA